MAPVGQMVTEEVREGKSSGRTTVYERVRETKHSILRKRGRRRRRRRRRRRGRLRKDRKAK
jgi:hypothetical protein